MQTVFLPGRDGNQLAFDVDGPADGPPVILMHGGGQTRGSWKTTFAALADAGWRAYSMDLRGHGESDWAADGDYTLDAFIGDLVCVIGQMPQAPVLAGASLGGISSIAAIGESENADLAAGLVVVDVAPQMEEAGRDRIGDFMSSNVEQGFGSLDEVADVLQAYNPHRPRPTNLAGLERNLRRGEDGRWYWHWDPAFINATSASRDETRTSSLVDENRLERAATNVKVPTLLVRGRMSDLLSEEGARQFLALVPHSSFVDVEGAGHMVAGDRNDLFNDSVVGFLAGLPNAPTH